MPLLLSLVLFPKLEGNLVVANQQSHSASIISLKDGHTVATLETGPGPHEAAVSPDGKTAVITQYGDREHVGNTLVLIDIPTAKLKETVSTGDATRPHGVAFLDNDTVVVTSETTKRLVVIDLKAGKVVRSMPTNQPLTHLLSLPADRKTVYAASIPVGIVTKFDAATGAKLGEAEVGKGSEGIGASPDGRWVVTANRTDATLSMVDTTTMKVKSALPAPGLPYRVAFTPNSSCFLVPNPGQNGVMVIYLSKVDANLKIDTDGAPGGIAVYPDNRHAFVTLLDKAAVAILDIQTRKVLATVPTGASPDGIAYSPVEPKA